MKNPSFYNLKNWWYYYKWYVICGIIGLAILIRLIGGAFGLWEKTPDLQIAYIGEIPLPENTVSAIEDTFASAVGDYNGDGEILVRLNQYVTGSSEADPLGTDLPLIGDIDNCDSYFFLMDDPEAVQAGYHLLANEDGSCPEDSDYSIEGKVCALAGIPLFSDADLGTYTDIVLGQETSGSNKDLLSGLFLGRRCFYNGETALHADQCSELWDTLTDHTASVYKEDE